MVYPSGRSAPAPPARGLIACWAWTAAATAAFAVCLLAGRPGSVALIVANVGSIVGPSVLLVAMIPRIARLLRRRSTVRLDCRQVAGIAMACSSAAFVVGQLIWSYYEIVLGIRSPYPSWADAAYLFCYVGTVVGLFLLPARRGPGLARWRTLLDVAMTVAGVATFSWYFLLAPILAAGDGTLLARAVSLAYPTLDLVLLLFALRLFADGGPWPRGLRGVLPIVLAECAVVIAIDAVFLYRTLHGGWQSGTIVDAGWPLAHMLQLVAAWQLLAAAPDAGATPGEAPATVPSRLVAFLPYAMLPPIVALAAVIVRADRWDAAAIGGCVGAATLLTLILGRQAVVLLKHERLSRALQTAADEAVRHREETVGINDALAIANAQLAEANERLRSLATTDAMTGLANHRAMQERLRAEASRSARTGSAFALLLIDVDHFKQLNDRFGHPAGDEVLRRVAGLIRAHVRAIDLPARYGGEEFAVICPDTNTRGIVAVAERVRATIAAHPFPTGAVTVSVGVACTETAGADTDALIAAADAALYTSKRAGRNRVTLAPA